MVTAPGGSTERACGVYDRTVRERWPLLLPVPIRAPIDALSRLRDGEPAGAVHQRVRRCPPGDTNAQLAARAVGDGQQHRVRTYTNGQRTGGRKECRDRLANGMMKGQAESAHAPPSASAQSAALFDLTYRTTEASTFLNRESKTV